jgi:hypothetical protein
MHRTPSCLLLCLAVLSCAAPRNETIATAKGPLRFTIGVAPGLSDAPLDGRVLVVLSAKTEGEPRLQVTDDDDSAQIVGLDVEGLGPSGQAVIGGEVLGYPVSSLAELPPGDYRVQAVLHRYETFRRADGHVVKLPPDRGEGQQWQLAPGNLLSTPRTIHVDPASSGTVQLTLDHAIPPLPPTPDTPYLKHVRFRSELLSRFWGRDVYLGALVLLPLGWQAHPQARYPLVVYHSHFDRELAGWRETPPDSALPPVNAEGIAAQCPDGHGPRCAPNGYDRVLQEAGWKFFQQWTGPGFPRVLLVQLQHANPYYDDSYAVNSQNVGPYGDAINQELIPYLEKTFRGLGPWARGTYGGSTGGWEALATQLLYPDGWNGTIANCPDPIDFHRFMTVDVYADANAYETRGTFRRTPRPATRSSLGDIRSLVEQDNQHELVVGTHSRSGGQFDIWEAVFSPVGPDGYPRRIWNKRTGVIDHAVADFWREHYDLGHRLERDWPTLGPKLEGKLIRINVGRMDSFYLDGAVDRVERLTRTLKNPTPQLVFDYGETQGHCWSGDHRALNAYSRLTYHARFIPLLAEHWQKTAPRGADVTSWKY